MQAEQTAQLSLYIHVSVSLYASVCLSLYPCLTLYTRVCLSLYACVSLYRSVSESVSVCTWKTRAGCDIRVYRCYTHAIYVHTAAILMPPLYRCWTWYRGGMSGVGCGCGWWVWMRVSPAHASPPRASIEWERAYSRRDHKLPDTDRPHTLPQSHLTLPAREPPSSPPPYHHIYAY